MFLGLLVILLAVVCFDSDLAADDDSKAPEAQDVQNRNKTLFKNRGMIFLAYQGFKSLIEKQFKQI